MGGTCDLLRHAGLAQPLLEVFDILGIAPAKIPDVRGAGGIGKAGKEPLDRLFGFTDPSQLRECRGTHPVTLYVFGHQAQTAVRPGQSRLVLS